MRMCLNPYLADQLKFPATPGKMILLILGHRKCRRSPVEVIQLPVSTVPFLDLYLSIEARRAKKEVISLETVDIYCEVHPSSFVSDEVFSLN